MSEPHQSTLGFEDEEFRVKRMKPKYKVGDEVIIKPEHISLKSQENIIWVITSVVLDFGILGSGGLLYFADKKGHEGRISTALMEDHIELIKNE